MTGPANPLIATPSASGTSMWSGIYLAEDIQSVDHAFRSNSWVDGAFGALGAFGTAVDTLSLVTDPLGTLATWGVSWLLEHVEPLRKALDWLAGDPATIAADAQTWRNISQVLSQEAAAFEAGVGDQAHWQGAAADAYRLHAREHLGVQRSLADAAGTMALITEGAGIFVGVVRMMVRNAVAEFVSTLAVRLPEWMAEEGFSLGLATPWVMLQVDTLVAKWVGQITKFLRGLANSLRNLRPLLTKLGGIIDELVAAARRLGEGSFGPQPALAGHGGLPGGPKSGSVGSLLDQIMTMAKPDWLKKLHDQGNEFDDLGNEKYPYNEVAVLPKDKVPKEPDGQPADGAESPKKQGRPRLDAYDHGSEIISRKNSQLSDVQPSTVRDYINELVRKYPTGTEIRSQKYPELYGKTLDGEYILEVPVQAKDIPDDLLKYAASKQVTIRDVDGNVYLPKGP